MSLQWSKSSLPLDQEEFGTLPDCVGNLQLVCLLTETAEAAEGARAVLSVTGFTLRGTLYAQGGGEG